jgi:photosynthetic reaction center cytochrome c subunit
MLIPSKKSGAKFVKTKTTTRVRLFILAALALALPGVRFLAPKIVRAQNNQAPATQIEKPFDQAQTLENLRKAISGQENKPAEEVFKNIQMLKGMPAARLLRVMELGYARSLGVNCTHCHVADAWEKEDKPTKQIAREMNAMAGVINNEQLKKIKNLKGPNSIINCTTCHRGQTKPALNLPESAPKE